MDLVQKRFTELAEIAASIATSKQVATKEYGGHRNPRDRGTRTYQAFELDDHTFRRWQTMTLAFLSRLLGDEDVTYKDFLKSKESVFSNAHRKFDVLYSIFEAAKADFEGGYMFTIRGLVHTEVFTNELDQAKHFLDAGYKVPSAVIAGTVLESSLRAMCASHPNLEPADNLNRMNNDLMREGVYNAAMHKQVGSWADIRNNAAHGRPEEFEPSHVDRMIEGIRDFVAKLMH